MRRETHVEETMEVYVDGDPVQVAANLREMADTIEQLGKEGFEFKRRFIIDGKRLSITMERTRMSLSTPAAKEADKKG